MHLALLGINHKTAPVELREQVSLTGDSSQTLTANMLDNEAISEVVPLSTCNRTEVYAVASRPEVGRREMMTALVQMTGADKRELEGCVYFHEGEQAVAHLYRVAGSLDSMVVGEAQILGQIKEAYESAYERESTSILLNRLFRHALEVGKRVRTETRIGENPVSVSSIAVEMTKKVFEDLSGKAVLLIGTGDMTELTARYLIDEGIASIMVANRTLERAQAMAERFDAQAVPFEALADYLPLIDILISSTGAPHYVVRKGQVERAMRMRRNRPIFFIDIAVPRDVDPGINDVNNAYLYDIDDLNEIASANARAREKEARRAESIILQEVDSFIHWMSSLEVVPTITALRDMAEQVKRSELERTLGKLDNLSAEERNRIEAMASGIVNKILHDPTVELKQAANERGGYLYIESLRRLFRLNGKGEDGD